MSNKANPRHTEGWTNFQSSRSNCGSQLRFRNLGDKATGNYLVKMDTKYKLIPYSLQYNIFLIQKYLYQKVGLTPLT